MEHGMGCGVELVGEGRRILLYIEVRGDLIHYFMWLFIKRLAKPNIFHNYLILTKG